MAAQRDRAHRFAGFTREQTLALALALLAWIVRALYLIESADNPFRLQLGLDPANYDRWAREILGGHPFGPEPFFQAPLYPYFVSGCYALLGADPLRPLWVQTLLGGLTTYLGARLGGRAWGWRGTLIVGLLLALYKPAIFYAGVLLVPTLATTLLALALWFASRRPLGSGLLIGLATLAHPVLLPAGLLAALGLAADERTDADHTGRARFRLPGRRVVLRMAAGIVLAILPATVHNLAVSGRFVPMSVNAGINLYIGNGPGANGFYRSPFGMRGEQDPLGIAEAARQSGRGLSAVEADRFWRDAARSAMASDPLRACGLLLRKVYFTLQAYETPQIESLDFEKRYSLLMRLPLPNWILLLALACGAVGLAHRRLPHAALLAGLLASSLAIALFFVTGRFRLPLHFLLALAAGGGLAELWTRVAARRVDPLPRGRLLCAGGAFAAALLLLGPNWLQVSHTLSFAQYHYRLGLIAEERGDAAGAMREYAAALEIDPQVARANINLGILTARQGDLDRARELLTRGVATDPRSARAHLALGQICQVRRDLDGAARHYADAWAADSTFTRALEALATTAYARGDLAGWQRLAGDLLARVGPQAPLAERVRFLAARSAERARHGLPVWSDAALGEADLAQASGDLPQAWARYEEALARDPRDRAALLEMARLAARRGDATSLRAFADRFRAAGGPAALIEPLEGRSAATGGAGDPPP